MTPNQEQEPVPSRLLSGVASPRLALVLIGLIVLLGVVGAVLPQEGRVSAGDLRLWQELHPRAAVLEHVGAYRVFHSWPFIAVVVLLAVNTLTCTLRHLLTAQRDAMGPHARWRRAGFMVLHVSLVGVMAGAFLSAGLRKDGSVVLTEGQSFTDEEGSYARFAVGPLRRRVHTGIVATLKQVDVDPSGAHYPAQVRSSLEFSGGPKGGGAGVANVNRPFEYGGLAFTQDETGFSPRIIVTRVSGRPVLDAFVALQTFRDKTGTTYRDFVALPPSSLRAMVTFYPSYRLEGEDIRKTGEIPTEPLVVIELENAEGDIVARGHVRDGEKRTMGSYSFGLAGYRRWSSFRVTNDPGYPVVCGSFWVGLIGIMLRYSSDVWEWLVRESRES